MKLLVVPVIRDYQRYCIDYIKNKPCAGLFLDMGLGKTLITLTALKELAQEGKLFGNVLIVAPKAVAISTWADEVDKWDTLKGTRIDLLVNLSKKKRLEKYDFILSHPNDAKIYTINTELFNDCVTYFLKKHHTWPFPTIVLDELQRFRSHKSLGTKRMLDLHKFNNTWIQTSQKQQNWDMYYRRPLQRIIGLTGTPGPKGLINLWGEVACLDGGFRLGKNITTFRNTYFNPGRHTKSGDVYEWIPKENAEQHILYQIKDVCISMKSDDKIKLPELIINNLYVEMTQKEFEVYDKMRREKVLPLVSETITAANAGVLCAQLLQLANGAIYGEKDDKNPSQKAKSYLVHNQKIDALTRIQEQAQEETLLVFYWFQHDLLRLQKAFPEAIVYDPKDPSIIKKWNNKEIPMLLAHPSKIGIGTNLQQGGHIMVWFSIPMWNLELYQQSIKRLHRSGQKETTIVHHILTKNTIDEDALESLNEKAKIQKESIIDPLDYQNPTLHTKMNQSNDLTDELVQIAKKYLS